MAYEIPPLRFNDSALAPAISANALGHHHAAIHGSYKEALNLVLLAEPTISELSVEALLLSSESLPAEIRDVVIEHAGAHANHQFFWKVIGPDGAKDPSGPLLHAIAERWGSMDGFRSAFKEAALALKPPGFVFLSLTAPRSKRLEIVALRRNDSVLLIGKPGVLICDLWEHAWASDHPSLNAWLDAFWTIVDWRVCEYRYSALVAGMQPE